MDSYQLYGFTVPAPKDLPRDTILKYFERPHIGLSQNAPKSSSKPKVLNRDSFNPGDFNPARRKQQVSDANAAPLKRVAPKTTGPIFSGPTDPPRTTTNRTTRDIEIIKPEVVHCRDPGLTSSSEDEEDDRRHKSSQKRSK